MYVYFIKYTLLCSILSQARHDSFLVWVVHSGKVCHKEIRLFWSMYCISQLYRFSRFSGFVLWSWYRGRTNGFSRCFSPESSSWGYYAVFGKCWTFISIIMKLHNLFCFCSINPYLASVSFRFKLIIAKGIVCGSLLKRLNALLYSKRYCSGSLLLYWSLYLLFIGLCT